MIIKVVEYLEMLSVLFFPSHRGIAHGTTGVRSPACFSYGLYSNLYGVTIKE